MRKGKHSATTLGIMTAADSGASPEQAWKHANKPAARAIWAELDWAPAPNPNCKCITLRRGVRISDIRARESRWAAGNLTSKGRAKGPLLLKSLKGTPRCRVVTGYIGFGRPGTCAYTKRVPPRVVSDLTAMTCRGKRNTPRNLQNDLYVSGRDKAKQGERMKAPATAFLTGLNVSTGEWQVRTVNSASQDIPAYHRKGSARLDVRPIRKAQ